MKNYAKFINEKELNHYYIFDVNESKEYKFEVGDYVVCKGYMDDINFKGEIGKITKKFNNNDALYTVIFLTKFNKFLYNAWNDPSGCSFNIDIKYLKPCDKKSLKKFKKKEEELNKKKEELRLKYRDVDPYGEEDWDVNESVEIPVIDYLKDKIIMYSTKKEMISIAKILNDSGFKTHTPLSKMKEEKFEYMFYYCNSDNIFVRSVQESKLEKLEKIYLSDLSKLLNGKFKKIENPELDPYGEEDWGWEEIKEN